jgi:hypothetical protein
MNLRQDGKASVHEVQTSKHTNSNKRRRHWLNDKTQGISKELASMMAGDLKWRPERVSPHLTKAQFLVR